jgi:hypothetical protein
VNLYLFAIKEHADDKQMAEIESALEPPLTAKTNGVPTWYGSDDDAWQDFSVQVR